MKKSLAVLALLAATGWTSAALADSDGWYLGGRVGPQELQDAKDSGANIHGKSKYELGVSGAGFVGYDFNGVRLEGELGYHTNDLNKIDGTGLPTNRASGSMDALSFMANGYYDFRTSTALTPYLGLGLGLARVNAGDVKVGGTPIVDDSDVQFAYQGIAGVSYAIDENWSASLDYRYFSTVDPNFRSASAGTFDSEYHSHAVLVGLTYKFAAPPKQVAEVPPPPPPPPAPAPAPVVVPKPSKPYLVFFDFDKSNITPEARKIILEAASTYKSEGKVRIVLTGHTDTVGTEKYNMALSLRRANAVAAVLEKQGVPKSVVTVIGKGKTEPLVPTGDGVREPQNRRAEIVLQ